MKFIFKKYLEFEKKYGDESTIESVEKMAEEYVQGRVRFVHFVFYDFKLEMNGLTPTER
jgi:hypothetical protein